MICYASEKKPSLALPAVPVNIGSHVANLNGV